MSIDPTKALFRLNLQFGSGVIEESISFNLTSDQQESAIVEAATPGVEINDTRILASRYSSIINAGLDPMRALIIANSEYIPVASGQTPSDATTLNLNFGEQENITITNAARLTEIHRQIRDFILNSANHLISDVKQFNVADFCSSVRRILNLPVSQDDTAPDPEQKINISDCINSNNPTVSGTVNTIISRLESLPQTILTSNADETSELDASAKILSVSDIARQYRNSAFFKSMIEYMLYDALIIEMIEYMSGIQSIRSDIINSYSLRKLQELQTTADSGFVATPAAALGNLFTQGNLSITSEQALSGFSQGSDSDQSSSITQDVSGMTNPTSVLSPESLSQYNAEVNVDDANNIDELFNMMTTLASKCMLADSVNTLKQAIGTDPVDIERNSVFEHHKGDLKRSMSLLRNTFFESVLPPAERFNDLPAETRLDEEMIHKIEDSIETNTLSEHYSEMFAALAFDEIYDITGRADVDLSLPKILSDVSGILKPSKNSNSANGVTITSYLKYALGKLAPSMPSEGQLNIVNRDGKLFQAQSIGFKSKSYSPTVFSNATEHGVLGNFLCRARKNSENVSFFPLETSHNIPATNVLTSFLTGPENFIDFALETGDSQLLQFSDFINQYVNVAEAFAKDIIKLTSCAHELTANTSLKDDIKPLGRMTPATYLKSVINQVGNELKNESASTTESVPGLAYSVLFSYGANNREKCFAAAFLGMLNTQSMLTADLAASNLSGTVLQAQVQTSEEKAKVVESKMNAIGTTMYLSHESVMEELTIKFFESYCQIDGLQTKSRKHFMNNSESYRAVLTDDDHYWLTDYDDEMARIDGTKIVSKHSKEIVPRDADGDVIMSYAFNKKSGDTKLAKTFRMRKHDATVMDAVALIAGTLLILGSIVGAAIMGVTVLAFAVGPAIATGLGIAGLTLGGGTVVGGMVIIATRLFDGTGNVLPAFQPLGPQISRSGSSFGIFLLDFHLMNVIDAGEDVTFNNESIIKAPNSNTPGLHAANDLSRQILGDGDNPANPLFGTVRNAIDNPYQNGEEFKWRWRTYPKPKGPIFESSVHHRAYIWWAWVSLLCKRTLSIKLTSHNSDEWNDASVSIHMYKKEILGVAQALIDVSSNLSTRNTQNMSAAEAESYNVAFDLATDLVQKAEYRQKLILDGALSMLYHANKIKSSLDKFKRYIRGGDGLKKTRLGIQALKSNNFFIETIKNISPESTSLMYANYLNKFRPSKNHSLFTTSDSYDLISQKLMLKILSYENFGLTNDEKRGAKTVLHAGITNSMIEIMRDRAFKSTKNSQYINTSKIAINVYKKNQLNTYELLYPKTYIFDMSAFILDRDLDGNSLRHINKFSDTWSNEDIINNVEITRWTNKNYKKFRAVIGKSTLSNGISNRSVLKNHLLDYAFKKYYNLVLGLDFSEPTFLLGSSLLDYSSVDGSSLSSTNDLQSDYQQLINEIISKYPDANNDSALSSQLFRITSALRSSSIFSIDNSLKSMLLPKKFDRVFSILINEKDFILNKESVDSNFTDIYETVPSFKLTSEFCRPNIKNEYLTDGTNIFLNNEQLANSNSQSNSTITKKYQASCLEDFPEAYSYYITVSILPDNTF